MWASYNGHIEVVILLIEKGADINARDSSGYTALKMASIMGHTEIANLLIEAGARE